MITKGRNQTFPSRSVIGPHVWFDLDVLRAEDNKLSDMPLLYMNLASEKKERKCIPRGVGPYYIRRIQV